MKTCAKCSTEKDAACFAAWKSGKLRAWCRECVSAYNKARYNAQTPEQREAIKRRKRYLTAQRLGLILKEDVPEGLKQCFRCKKVLPLLDFGKKSGHCRPCNRERMKKWYSSLPFEERAKRKGKLRERKREERRRHEAEKQNGD